MPLAALKLFKCMQPWSLISSRLQRLPAPAACSCRATAPPLFLTTNNNNNNNKQQQFPDEQYVSSWSKPRTTRRLGTGLVRDVRTWTLCTPLTERDKLSLEDVSCTKSKKICCCCCYGEYYVGEISCCCAAARACEYVTAAARAPNPGSDG